MRYHLWGFTVSALLHLGVVMLWLTTPIKPVEVAIKRPVPVSIAMFRAQAPEIEAPAAVKQIAKVPARELPSTPEPKPVSKPVPKQESKSQSKPEPTIARRVEFNPPARSKPVDQSRQSMRQRVSKPKLQEGGSRVQPSTLRQAKAKQRTLAPSGEPIESSSIPPEQRALIEAHYLASVRQAIEANKFYPPRARRMRREGTVEVRFVIRRDGSIEDIALASGSGSLKLDNAAIQAILKVGYFPAFPLELARNEWSFVLPMDYFLRSR